MIKSNNGNGRKKKEGKNKYERNYFLIQQTVNDVPRLAPENYRAWFTGPGRYKHIHGLKQRPGTYFIRSGLDRLISSDQKNNIKNVVNKSEVIEVEEKIMIEAQDKQEEYDVAINDNSIDTRFDVFGMNSGGYEPDEASRNIELETAELNKAMDLFRGNKLREAKKIYERILGSRKFNRANRHNTQAARFNLGSVLYRLHSYKEAIDNFNDLIRDHQQLLKIEKDEPSSPPNQFEYMTLVYNLIGDMLFYRKPDIGRGLEILHFAKNTVHTGDVKFINHINAIIQQWAHYWNSVTVKNTNHVMGLANAGALLYEVGQFGEAKKLLERVDILNPKHSFPQAYFNLAMIEISEKKLLLPR